jgi:hypothetical protein
MSDAVYVCSKFEIVKFFITLSKNSSSLYENIEIMVKVG